MGPITLLRGLGHDRDAQRDHLTESVVQLSAHIAHARDWVAALPQRIRPAVDSVADAPRRLWASESTTTVCVVGGLLAAPLLTVAAWVGLLMPEGAMLHEDASALVLVALVLLALALVSAQTHVHRTSSPEE